ncbi:MAG: N-formylglutamate deformylase [Alphaproteobacteria bacterium]|nr:N-formylglutamate deformylase [Alphaproteobacteria bacterium]
MSKPPPWLEVERGDAPLLLSFPHTGREIPADCTAGLVSPERAIRDADWFVEKLYAFAAELRATTVRTALSRTVIDVNRDPSGASLYPGQATTGLVPSETFDGLPLYLAGHEPGEQEIERRRAEFFSPYHAALADELARLRAMHGAVVLYDCHSIRSSIPRLFPGELPVFNIGTNDGKSCSPRLAEAIQTVCRSSPYSHVLNGRFKGGWITRRYGQPHTGIHAVQMELAIRSYLHDEAAPHWDADAARPMQDVLRKILEACLEFGRAAVRGDHVRAAG